MKTPDGWRQHLNELVNARLDPVVYAVQWARDPRCLQRGTSHRRVGAFQLKNAAWQFWSAAGVQNWK